MCWSLLQNEQDFMIELHTTRGHWTQWVPDSHVFVSAEDNVAPQLPKPYQLACEMLSPDCLALNRTSWILMRNQSQSEFLMSQNSRRYQHFISSEMNISHEIPHFLSPAFCQMPSHAHRQHIKHLCKCLQHTMYGCFNNIMLIIKTDITKYIDNPEERPVYNFQITELLGKEHQWLQNLMYKWDSIGSH